MDNLEIDKIQIKIEEAEKKYWRDCIGEMLQCATLLQTETVYWFTKKYMGLGD